MPVTRLLVFTFGLMIALQAFPGQAQAGDRRISYGQTVSGMLEAGETSHVWTFEGHAREIVRATVFRISGQFVPRVRLLDGQGSDLAVSQTPAFADSDEVLFYDGLPVDATYQVQVSAESAADIEFSPNEYSLTLVRLGTHLSSLDDGFSPLPPEPEKSVLETGILAQLRLGRLALDVYSDAEPPTLDQPDPLRKPLEYVLSAGARRVTINNTNPILPGIRSFTFQNDGVGFSTQIGEVQFFADQDFSLKYNDGTKIFTVVLGDGQEIVTDFARLERSPAPAYLISSIQAVGGRVDVKMISGQRVLLSGSTIGLLARNTGPNQESVLEVALDGERYINTDMQGWHTLVYLDQQAGVFYGLSGRLITDDVHLDLFNHDDAPSLHDIAFNQQHKFSIDWFDLGDMRVEKGLLTLTPLDGRTLTESVADIASLLIKQGAVYIERTDGTYQLSLPDHTQIDTPAEAPSDAAALPNESGYEPRGFNNLGTNPLPLCPCITSGMEHRPVNPANGNFFYSVQDFDVPSHTLELNLTRYYNSQGGSLTPAYMIDSPAGYLPGRMGPGWRHSYQYELDITYAPLGRVTLILPDGARHVFTADLPDGSRYRSHTLLSWTVERVGGLLGTWTATRSDGVQYLFDQAGRLLRIARPDKQSIVLAPAPINHLTTPHVGGVFIVEPYGRRLELYTGASGYIELASLVERQITYTYDGGLLSGVSYITSTQTATYRYAYGVLSAFEDIRSPYSASGALEYDARTRVTRYVENPNAPDGSPSRIYTYDYSQPDRTVQTTTVSGVPRVSTWQYDEEFLLVNYQTPGSDTAYSFTYDSRTDLPVFFQQPDKTNLTFAYDDRGFVTGFKDPVNVNGYTFDYEIQNYRVLVKKITYPNGRVDNFEYNDGGQLVAYRQLVEAQPRHEYVTRYEYDSWGRVAAVIKPGPRGEDVRTTYAYDDFGYVREIVQDNIPTPRTLRYTYDLLGRLHAVTDGRNNTITLDWNNVVDRVSVISVPTPVSSMPEATIAYTYDAFGRIETLNDRGNTTQYTYNALGQLIALTDANDQTTSFEYDEVGNLTKRIDALGQEFTYTYDELDQLTGSASPSAPPTTYETVIETDGKRFTQRRVHDPAGRLIVYRYNNLGQLAEVTLRDGNYERTYSLSYDPVGLLTSIKELPAEIRTLEYDYNLLGWVTATRTRGGDIEAATTYTYNPAGELETITSPGGRVTRYDYDLLGNVIQVARGMYDARTKTMHDLQTTATYSYDENGNLLTALDAQGLTTQYSYDAPNRVVGVTDPGGNRTTYGYDTRGNQIGLADPLGNAYTAQYDVMNRLTRVVYGEGVETSYEYDQLGRLTAILDPRGRRTDYTYNLAGKIVAVSQGASNQTYYGYDTLGRLTGVTDALGHTTVYNYDRAGNLDRIVDAVGNAQQFAWHASSGQLGTYTDANGRNYEYHVDSLGRVVRIIDRTTSRPISTDYVYDLDGYIVGVRSGSDQVRGTDQDVSQSYTYSPLGLPTAYVDPEGRQWTMNYTASGLIQSVTDSAGIVAEYNYDDAGHVTQIKRAAGTPVEGFERYEYDRNGNIVRYTAPDGVTTEYAYDTNNRLAKIIEAVGTPLQRQFVFDYDALGYLTRTIDPAGRTTDYAHDVQGRLIRISRNHQDATGGQNAEYRYTYDLVGNLISVQLPGGQAFNMTYDALNRRVRFVDPENGVWSYVYDPAGNLLATSDPLGNRTEYRYDSMDRVNRITYANGSIVELGYDDNGNLRTISSPHREGDDPASIERGATMYTFDRAGKLLQIDDSDGSVTRFTYDAAGRVATRSSADGDSVTSYGYDEQGRLTQIRYPDDTRVLRSYDASGRVSEIQSPAGTISMVYDVLGRLESVDNGGDTLVVYEYADNVTDYVSRRDAGDYGTIEYTYDDLYRPVRIVYGEQSVDITYDLNGWRTALTRSNGVETLYQYDKAGRPISIVHLAPDGQKRLDLFTYQYDAVGNIVRVDRLDGWSVLYSYDVAHQLIDERWLDDHRLTRYTLSLNYDAAGNRVEALVTNVQTRSRTLFLYNRSNQLIGEVRNYDPGASQSALLPIFGLGVASTFAWRRRKTRWIPLAVAILLAIPSLAQIAPRPDVIYSYDPSGNLGEIVYVGSPNGDTDDKKLVFDYDNTNRLVGVSGQMPDGTLVNTRLSYDALSRVVEWSGENNVIYRLHYDGDRLIAMTGPTGDGTRYFTPFAGDYLMTLTATGGAQWMLDDVTGSVRKVTDSLGQVVNDPYAMADYNAFGELIDPQAGQARNAGQMLLMPLYDGQLYDPTTQLYLTQTRGYDPRTGRFIQRDPVRHPAFGTLYTYAYNRPTVYRDPSGMVPESALVATFAPNIPDVSRPLAAPQPLVQEFPVPVQVNRLQADDNVRLLNILERSTFGLNEATGVIDPLLRDFYFYRVNPVGEWAASLGGKPVRSLLAHYDSNNDWLFNPHPSPAHPPDPLAALYDSEALLAQALRLPLDWCSGTPHSEATVPSVPDPSSTLRVVQRQDEMLDTLGRVLLMTALQPETLHLNDLVGPIEPLAPTMPHVVVPDPQAQPPAVAQLNKLIQQQKDFMDMVLGTYP